MGQLEKFNVTHPSISLIPRPANTKVHQDIGDEHKRKFIFFANSFDIDVLHVATRPIGF
ncbi:MAG: hypothetical protein RSD99_18240 [Janthinobacterium sp.]